MEVNVTLREIVIKDRQSGKEHIVRTLRTAEEIASYVEESEKDEIRQIRITAGRGRMRGQNKRSRPRALALERLHEEQKKERDPLGA